MLKLQNQICFAVLILLICNARAIAPQQSIVIGIYTQDYVYGDYDTTIPDRYLTYLISSYSNIPHMAGAYVVPIFAYNSQKSILQKLGKINGVIFTGGDAVIDIKNQWTQNALLIMKYAQQQNNKGNQFPILGICQGLQLMLYLTSNMRQNFLDKISGDLGKFNPLTFVNQTSYYLFNGLSDSTMQTITNASTTQQGGIFFYYHSYGILQSTFNKDHQLRDYWNLMALSTSSENDTYVTYLQAKDYPFYITQFHPQRIYTTNFLSERTYQAQIQSIQKMSLNFILKARHCKNIYPKDQLLKTDINNYPLKQSNRFVARIYLFQEPNEDGMLIQSSSDGHALRIFIILLIVIVGIVILTIYFFKHRQQKQKSQRKSKSIKNQQNPSKMEDGYQKEFQLNQEINEAPKY